MISILEISRQQQIKKMGIPAALGGAAGIGGVMSTDTYKTGKTLKKGADKLEDLKDKGSGFLDKLKNDLE